jgi:hypothetical protein
VNADCGFVFVLGEELCEADLATLLQLIDRDPDKIVELRAS